MVFVHGLGGDAFETWRYGADKSTSWPHLLGEDFPDLGVWSVGFAASPTKWQRLRHPFSKSFRDAGHGMALPDRALEVLNLMAQGGLGERPILFICHSLGGLVVKQILRRSSDAFDQREKAIFLHTRAVLFLATPHSGADLASLVSAFRRVFRATVTIQDLKAHDAHLGELYDWYRNHAEAAGVRTVTYFEGREIGGVTIVKRGFAHPGVGSNPIPLDEDHISIAKPPDRQSQVYVAARQLLRDCVLRPDVTPTRATNTDGLPSAHRREPEHTAAPQELPPAAGQFFGRKHELEHLTARLRSGKNTAVVGYAGMGKTALAASALQAVVGDTALSLASSPFPDGVVYLDLYALHSSLEAAWGSIANKLAGPDFMERATARERAVNACNGRRFLLVIEGGEELDGQEGRADLPDFLSVLSQQNRRLLLTRLNTQATHAETVELNEALHPDDAAQLFDSLTRGHVHAAVREQVLSLLEGHPLALTWAGSLLARGDESPQHLVEAWTADQLPGLTDPVDAEHTLRWLFERSVRRLDENTKQALAAAGLLARAPFPLAAIQEALGDPRDSTDKTARQALRTLVQRSLLKRTSPDEDQWQFTHVLGYRFARQESGSDPELRTRLGQWLYASLSKALAEADAPTITRALEHVNALLRTDDDQRLWFPLANFALFEATDRLTDLGHLGQVKLALSTVAGWMGRFPPAKARDSEWLRERLVLMNRQGDVLRDQGDLAEALAAYQQVLQIAKRLAEADLSDAMRQRDLSVAHNRIGDMLKEQGDLEGALVAYQNSLRIRQSLAKADPSEAGWQHDLSVTHGKIGDVLSEKGDRPGALAAIQQCLQTFQGLAEADPSNVEYQRNISVSHERIGSLLLDQGDFEGALTAFQNALSIWKQLTQVDVSNAVRQRGLSYSLTQLAQVHAKNGNIPEALRLAQESLAIDERLAALDPTNATWQKDVRVSRTLVKRLEDVMSEG